MAQRQNAEQPIIDRFEQGVEAALGESQEWVFFRGFGGDNRFSPRNWDLRAIQMFQLGDCRVDLPDRHVVVEVEGAGGETNLVKYWPQIEELERPFLLIHVSCIATEQDYISHRLLWDFPYQRMARDMPSGRFRAWRFSYGEKVGHPLKDALACFQTA